MAEHDDIAAAYIRASSSADNAWFARYPDPHTRPDHDNLPADLSALSAESDGLFEQMCEAYNRVIAEPCGSLDDVIAKVEWPDGEAQRVLEAIAPDLRRLNAAV